MHDPSSSGIPRVLGRAGVPAPVRGSSRPRPALEQGARARHYCGFTVDRRVMGARTTTPQGRVVRRVGDKC